MPMIRSFLLNFLWAYLIMGLCRAVFVAENWGLLSPQLTAEPWGRLFTGSLLFDTSALLYLMAPYALAALLPLPAEWKARSSYNLVLRLLFMLAMVLIVASNLGDALYFPYTGRRTTGTVMGEFAHENNLLGIVAAEMLRHWYIVIAGVVMLWASWRCYRSASPFPWERKSCWRSTAAALLALVCYVPLSVAGMRGGFTTAVRPVTISNAFQYAASPQTAAVVLNTPFSLIRTWNKAVFRDPGFYSAEELDRIYSPVHPASGEEMLRRNVVVMICESLGQEYFGHYNDYEGQTPFLDSLCRESLTFRENYANGRKSIDGMPS
ncbi:MAG: LTA synthase family protein, partial [Bacteroidaceae bacterium]|nr:LTA synthase family protein [Bacteroidaceae bacterium]